MKKYFKLLFKFTLPMLTVVLLAIFAIKIFMPDGVACEFIQNSKISNDNKTTEETDYVFVGDSRYVAMEEIADSNDIFISECSIGYNFLEEQMDNIKLACDENTALIIGLGVNDVNYNCQKYIDKLNHMAKYMDCKIFYMSVNPVDEKLAVQYNYQIKNSYIDKFNDQIKSALDERITFIDTNSYLKVEGFTTKDGLHYTEETTKDTYNYIKETIENYNKKYKSANN